MRKKEKEIRKQKRKETTGTGTKDFCETLGRVTYILNPLRLIFFYTLSEN